MSDLSSALFSPETRKSFSAILVRLLKGPLYRSRRRDLWEILLRDQQTIRAYFQPLGLQLTLDEAEGFAFLAQQRAEDDEENDEDFPRLIPRRRLTFNQTLLLVALRKRLAEHDEEESAPRLVVARSEIHAWLRPYLPEENNEVKQQREIDALIKKVCEMGFLSALTNHPDEFEVMRIIKALVNAEQIAAFSALLQEKCAVDSDRENDDAAN